MRYDAEFAEILNKHLNEADRDAAWLKRRLGVSHSTVNRWLSGETQPGKPKIVADIAKALNLSEEQKNKLFAATDYNYQNTSEEKVDDIQRDQVTESPADVEAEARQPNIVVNTDNRSGGIFLGNHAHVRGDLVQASTVYKNRYYGPTHTGEGDLYVGNQKSVESLLGELRKVVAETIAEAEQDKAMQRVEWLHEAVTEPDLALMESVVKWFTKREKSLAESLYDFIEHPVVVEAAEATGEVTADEYHQKVKEFPK